MRRVLNVIAALLLLTGIVWTLQGANVLPGSFMTGQIFWLVMGLIAIVVGGGLLVLANRQRDDGPPTPDSK